MRSMLLLITGLMLSTAAVAQTGSNPTPGATPTPMASQTPSQTPGRTAMPAPTTPAPAPADGTAAAPMATPAASGTIVQALPRIPAHATLVKLLTAAKLDAALAGPGPFTLFAPNDEAFARLPAGTLDTLLAPANVASLTTILKNHVVAGSVTSEQLKAQIAAGGGRATLTTLSGQSLTATIDNGSILLTDAVGNKSYVDKPVDVQASNGVIHATNGISLPKLG